MASKRTNMAAAQAQAQAEAAEQARLEAEADAPVYLSYRVIAPLRHNGHRYAPGDLVALSPEQAARLIGLRVVTDQAVESA